jgi:hypothetical protein
VSKNPTAQIAASDLDRLLTTLEVDFVRLAECLVCPGWRLSLGPADTPGIHYNLAGVGRIVTDEWPPIPLSPHTLAVLPPRTVFRIEVDDGTGSTLRTVESRQFPPFEPGKVRRVFEVGFTADRRKEDVTLAQKIIVVGCCFATTEISNSRSRATSEPHFMSTRPRRRRACLRPCSHSCGGSSLRRRKNPCHLSLARGRLR